MSAGIRQVADPPSQKIARGWCIERRGDSLVLLRPVGCRERAERRPKKFPQMPFAMRPHRAPIILTRQRRSEKTPNRSYDGFGIPVHSPGSSTFIRGADLWPPDLQGWDLGKMLVERGNGQAMLNANCRDPDVVFGNRSSASP